MRRLIGVFVWFVAGLVSSEDPAEPVVRKAVQLSVENFKTEVEKSAHFVMFFAPWCSHCKTLAPTWEELANIVNRDTATPVTIARVDCTFFPALCSAQDVSGYPTLKFFRDGAEKEDGVKYRGKRDRESLQKFIKEQVTAGTS